MLHELRKILEEINRASYLIDPNDTNIPIHIVRDIIHKHMIDNECGDCSRRKWYLKGYEDGSKDNDGWISIDDERLWDILFEEACVEGEQERRIYDRLKDISSKS